MNDRSGDVSLLEDSGEEDIADELNRSESRQHGLEGEREGDEVEQVAHTEDEESNEPGW